MANGDARIQFSGAGMEKAATIITATQETRPRKSILHFGGVVPVAALSQQ